MVKRYRVRLAEEEQQELFVANGAGVQRAGGGL